MFSSSKSGWHLPATLLATSLILYFLVGLWFDGWISSAQIPQTEPLFGFLSPETIQALNNDERLNNAIISLTETIAEATSNYGEQYSSDNLKELAQSLNEQIVRMKSAQPRQKRGAQGEIVVIPTGPANETQQSAKPGGGLLSELGQMLGGAGMSGLTGLLSGMGGSLAGGLAEPALFLGIGVGMGAETSLNLTDMEEAKALASHVASTYNATATGINMVAQNFGTGLSSQLAPSLSNLGSGMQMGMAAFALAQGMGQGTASGLNLTQQKFQPSNGTDVMAIATNLGLGMSEPIAGSIDVQKLVSRAGASGGQMMQNLPQIAAAAGRGLGEGASDGLGLTKQNTQVQRRQIAGPPSPGDISGSVEEFSRGLSQSFLQNADLSRAFNMMAPGAEGGMNFDVMSMIMPLAAGAGMGIGEGAAIGFGFKTDDGPMAMKANSSQSTQAVMAEFTKNMVASFLANGTADAALQNITSGAGGLSMNIDTAKVVEGMGRGLIEGGAQTISMAGGIENLVSGNFSIDMESAQGMRPTTFDDSVNGSAVAFARGLGGEGTLVIAKMFTKASESKQKKRNLEGGKTSVAPHRSLRRRQEPGTSPQPALGGNMFSSLAQTGADALTCQGFGGIAAVALGLMNSGTIKVDMKNPMPAGNPVTAIIPQEPITIMSEGNRFEIKIQDSEVIINGLKLLPFAVLTALHIVLTTFAFFYALPAYLALGAIWRLSVLVGYPLTESDNKKWRRRVLLFLFLPSAISGIVLGIVGMGNSIHFRSAHGILGLVTLIFTLPTSIYIYIRLQCTAPIEPSYFAGLKSLPQAFRSPAQPIVISATLNQIALQVGTIAWVTGFSELRAISLCITDAILTAPTIVGALTGIVFLQVSAMALVGFRGWIEQRIAKKDRLGGENGGKRPEVKRSDTMATFGFDSDPSRNVSPSRTAAPGQPQLVQRGTQELLGREDSKIGWPSNVRKVGDDDMTPPEQNNSQYPYFQGDVGDASPFAQTRNNSDNEKQGAAQTEYYRSSVQNGQYTSYRPSSEVEPAGYAYTGDPIQAGYVVGLANSPYTSGLTGVGNQSGTGSKYTSFSRPRPSEEFASAGHVKNRPSGEEMRMQYGELMKGRGISGGADERGYPDANGRYV